MEISGIVDDCQKQLYRWVEHRKEMCARDCTEDKAFLKALGNDWEKLQRAVAHLVGWGHKNSVDTARVEDLIDNGIGAVVLGESGSSFQLDVPRFEAALNCLKHIRRITEFGKSKDAKELALRQHLQELSSRLLGLYEPLVQLAKQYDIAHGPFVEFKTSGHDLKKYDAAMNAATDLETQIPKEHTEQREKVGEYRQALHNYKDWKEGMGKILDAPDAEKSEERPAMETVANAAKGSTPEPIGGKGKKSKGARGRQRVKGAKAARYRKLDKDWRKAHMNREKQQTWCNDNHTTMEELRAAMQHVRRKEKERRAQK